MSGKTRLYFRRGPHLWGRRSKYYKTCLISPLLFRREPTRGALATGEGACRKIAYVRQAASEVTTKIACSIGFIYVYVFKLSHLQCLCSILKENKCILLIFDYTLLLFARARGCKICIIQRIILILHPILSISVMKTHRNA